MHEYDGRVYHEEEYGFFVYSQEEGVLCVWDIYTKPEYRSGKYCWLLFDRIKDIAASKGCSEIEGYVDKFYREQERSKKVLEVAGFELFNENDECYWYRAKL
jgi:hypothetical protein